MGRWQSHRPYSQVEQESASIECWGGVGGEGWVKEGLSELGPNDFDSN